MLSRASCAQLYARIPFIDSVHICVGQAFVVIVVIMVPHEVSYMKDKDVYIYLLITSQVQVVMNHSMLELLQKHQSI